MNYHSLMELHASSMNIFSDLSQYNELNGELSGTCNIHIEVTPEAVKHYIDVAGYASDGYLKNQVEEFVPSYLGNLNQQQRKSFCKTTTQVLQKLAKESYPSHVGSVTFFDWGTPRIYLFDSKSDTESANTATPGYKKHSVSRRNEKEDTNSPLSTSADSFQRRLLRQQVQIDDNNSHDDDLQVKPTSPSPNDNSNSLRQAVEQQQQATTDDDDDANEKKKRDRRLQRQHTRQRQSQHQTEQEKQDETARIIRERCLAAEAKRNAELKHPKRNNGSGHSANGQSHQPTPDNGPSF